MRKAVTLLSKLLLQGPETTRCGFDLESSMLISVIQKDKEPEP